MNEKTALFIGRFQPFHKGHLCALEWIAKRNGKIIIAIGSAQKKNEPDNPFSALERKRMIAAQVRRAGLGKMCAIVAVTDVNDNARWVAHVDRNVPRYDAVYSNNALVRRLMKRAGKNVFGIPFFKKGKYNATQIREMMKKKLAWHDRVPKKIREHLKRMRADERIGRL